MDDGVMVPLVFFAFLAAIIIVPQVLKSRDRQRMYEVMRAAYERGQTPTPEMMAMMSRGAPPAAGPAADLAAMDLAIESSSERDLRRGVAWTAVGVGLLVIGVIGYAVRYADGGSVEWMATFAALGAVPLCVGLAFLALWGLAGRRKPA